MPMRKYRSLEEANADREYLLETAPLEQRIADILEISNHLFPVAFPPGVRKYRSLEEAQRDREAWLKNAARVLREKRKSSSSP